MLRTEVHYQTDALKPRSRLRWVFQNGYGTPPIAPRRRERFFESNKSTDVPSVGDLFMKLKELAGNGPHGRNEYERHDRLGSKRAPSAPLGSGSEWLLKVIRIVLSTH